MNIAYPSQLVLKFETHACSFADSTNPSNLLSVTLSNKTSHWTACLQLKRMYIRSVNVTSHLLAKHIFLMVGSIPMLFSAGCIY